jgi:hypothetical protein
MEPWSTLALFLGRICFYVAVIRAAAWGLPAAWRSIRYGVLPAVLDYGFVWWFAAAVFFWWCQPRAHQLWVQGTIVLALLVLSASLVAFVRYCRQPGVDFLKAAGGLITRPSRSLITWPEDES